MLLGKYYPVFKEDIQQGAGEFLGNADPRIPIELSYISLGGEGYIAITGIYARNYC